MNLQVYRYHFSNELPLEEIEASLALALVGAESLHGECRLALDAGLTFDAEQRCCVIDASSPVGGAVCCLFTGFLRRQFGHEKFRVERVQASEPLPTAA